jgi:hypothetical protein
MTLRPRLRHGLAALGAGLAALAACAAFAGTPVAASKGAGANTPPAAAAIPAAQPQKASPAPAATLPSLGLMAFLDPETGQLTGPISYLVPPADQRAASATVLLTPVQRLNGAWLLDLKGTLMESYILQIDPLGNRRVVCVQDPRLAPQMPLAPLAPPAEVR